MVATLKAKRKYSQGFSEDDWSARSGAFVLRVVATVFLVTIAPESLATATWFALIQYAIQRASELGDGVASRDLLPPNFFSGSVVNGNLVTYNSFGNACIKNVGNNEIQGD